MFIRIVLALLFVMSSGSIFAQAPLIEPGVSQELARWRAAHYSDVRYKLNLTLEKMSPVLKGTMEIRVKVSEPPPSAGGFRPSPIILDWRKIKGHEHLSTISNLSINGVEVKNPPANAGGSDLSINGVEVKNPPANAGGSDLEHLVFRDGVVAGENVIKLDFTSPILTSGSAITRYVDKEDGSEYIYSLFVPSDASTAFPVFDQPDLKARVQLTVEVPILWQVISNSDYLVGSAFDLVKNKLTRKTFIFLETQPISTYVFAFAAGPFEEFADKGGNPSSSEGAQRGVASNSRTLPTGRVSASTADLSSHIYVRKSQAKKFEPHSSEVFRLNREGIKHLETYFDYKFPFPKYDIVLIPEFPFGGMEHAGATFLREASVIFPSEPTANDYISRANVIFHEAAHQWFGDTVTMRWFDDLWLKEGFAEFMAYKTLEKVMPQYNAWKVFYERNKQAAYLTDSTKGTTPIYQEIKNLSAAKSAYGNIVYRKAPSFLKQAEFYFGEDKFQTAVRAFLKKHEFGNAEWTDLVKEFESARGMTGGALKIWSETWIKQPGLGRMSIEPFTIWANWGASTTTYHLKQRTPLGWPNEEYWFQKLRFFVLFQDERKLSFDFVFGGVNVGGGADASFNQTIYITEKELLKEEQKPVFVFPNYQDYGYGIFLLDDKSRDYVLKNIHNEKDDFLRAMMWGSLWDSVREGELDPKEYVELAIRHIGVEKDESTIQSIIGRVSTAMNYYMPVPPAVGGSGGNLSGSEGAPQPTGTLPTGRVSAMSENDLRVRLEDRLIERMQNSSTAGQRITYYRAFLNTASTENGRSILKDILKGKFGETGRNPRGSKGEKAGRSSSSDTLPTGRVSASDVHIVLRTKDKFDIVTRLAILGDPDAAKLLADLEKSETSDEAKRYAYAAKAAFDTKETKEKYFNEFLNNKEISESWIEAAFVPFNSIRHSDLTLPYLTRALAELPNLKRTRKIFFINGWLGAFIGGQRDEKALAIVNKFLADNPDLDKDLRLKILENVDLIERAVKIRGRYTK